MAIAAPLALAATALSAGGAVMQGIGSANSLSGEAQQMEEQSQLGQIKAAQTNTYMQTKLSQTLSNIKAVGAAQGTEGGTPTQDAVSNYSNFLGTRDRTQQVGGILDQVQLDQQASALYRNQAQNALIGGFMSAGMDVASGVAGGIKSGGLSFGGAASVHNPLPTYG